jgi:hypothetical protein
MMECSSKKTSEMIETVISNEVRDLSDVKGETP